MKRWCVNTNTFLRMRRIILDVKDDARLNTWPQKLWLNTDSEFNTSVIDKGLFFGAFEAGKASEGQRCAALQCELETVRSKVSQSYVDGTVAGKEEAAEAARVLRQEAKTAYLQGLAAGKEMAADARKKEDRGIAGECWVHKKLQAFFPSALITDTASQAHSADMLFELQGIKILVEVKNTAVFAPAQLDKFKHDIEVREPRAQAGIYVSLNETSPVRTGDVQIDMAGSTPVFTLHGVFADPGKLRLAVLTIQQILVKVEFLKRTSSSSDAERELQDIRERAHDILHGPVIRHIKQLRASMTATSKGVNSLESVIYENIANLLRVKAPKKTGSKPPTAAPKKKIPRMQEPSPFLFLIKK